MESRPTKKLFSSLVNGSWQAVSHAIGLGHKSRPTPIKILPPEILNCILELVLQNHICVGQSILRIEMEFENRKSFIRSPKYPELLSHVCSRWRQTMVTSPGYWTHIDLAPYHRFNKKILDRAETFASRARHLPLNIHLLGVAQPTPIYDTQLRHLLSSYMPQTSALNMVINCAKRESYVPIIEDCFRNAIPGTLVQLSMSGVVLPADIRNLNRNYRSNVFLESVEARHEAQSLCLQIPQATLEDLWFPIKVLRVNGPYPHWRSCAYSALVELRLSAHSSPSISRSALANMLASSPELRILQLQVSITAPAEEQYQQTRVRLAKLELLHLQSGLEAILSMLCAGSKPLRLIMNIGYQPENAPLVNIIREFFARSNVTVLHLHHLHSYSLIAEIPLLAPRLHTLIINNSALATISASGSSQNGGLDDSRFRSLRNAVSQPQPTADAALPDTQAPEIVPHLDKLYILLSFVYLEDILDVVRLYSVNVLLLGGSHVSRKGGVSLDTMELRRHLSHVCSKIYILAGKGAPVRTDQWEFAR